MKTKLTKKEQQKVRDWCDSWYTLQRKNCTLVEWIMLKLTTDQAYGGAVRQVAGRGAQSENERQ